MHPIKLVNASLFVLFLISFTYGEAAACQMEWADIAGKVNLFTPAHREEFEKSLFYARSKYSRFLLKKLKDFVAVVKVEADKKPFSDDRQFIKGLNAWFKDYPQKHPAPCEPPPFFKFEEPMFSGEIIREVKRIKVEGLRNLMKKIHENSERLNSTQVGDSSAALSFGVTSLSYFDELAKTFKKRPDLELAISSKPDNLKIQ
jgi:hypothetical protein